MGLLDDLAIDYTPWRPHDTPDQPQGIEGVVKDRQVWTSDYGTFDVIFIAALDGQNWSWAALGAVAAKEVGRRNPLPGDRIGVAYKGAIPITEGPGIGKDMHIFRMLTVPGPAHAPGSGYVAPEPMAAPQQALPLEAVEPF